MYAWLKPKAAIPMHGEARHLREHAKLAREAGVPQVHTFTDGQIVHLAPGPAMVVGEAPVGRLFRDGKLIVPSVDGPVRDRRKLSTVGIVAVAIAIDANGVIAADSEVEIDGVPKFTADGRSMQELILIAVEGTLDGIPPKKRKDEERVKDAVRRTVRATVDQQWGKKPIVKVLVCLV